MLRTTVRVFDVNVELSPLPTKGTRYDRIKLKENVNSNKNPLTLNFNARTNIGNVNGYVKVMSVVKKSNYDYVELTFFEDLMEIGTKVIKFNELINQDSKTGLKKCFEQLYNKYKFVENETTKELHKQLNQKDGDYQSAQKRIKKLEQELQDAKQETRDERAKGLTEYMRFEREIGDMQKAKEKVERSLVKTSKEVQYQLDQTHTAFSMYKRFRDMGKDHNFAMGRLRERGLAHYLEK